MVVGFGAETRLEGGEMSQSGEEEQLCMGLSTAQPPAVECDGCWMMFMSFPLGCCVG